MSDNKRIDGLIEFLKKTPAHAKNVVLFPVKKAVKISDAVAKEVKKDAN